jgi:hypothetical protein
MSSYTSSSVFLIRTLGGCPVKFYFLAFSLRICLIYLFASLKPSDQMINGQGKECSRGCGKVANCN